MLAGRQHSGRRRPARDEHPEQGRPPEDPGVVPHLAGAKARQRGPGPGVRGRVAEVPAPRPVHRHLQEERVRRHGAGEEGLGRRAQIGKYHWKHCHKARCTRGQ